MSGPRLLAVLLVASFATTGCRLHMERVLDNRSPATSAYGQILLGEDGQRQVLAKLGPPDRVDYQHGYMVFDYESGRHRSTELEFFVPSEIIPFADPLFILTVLRFLLDPSEEPEEFRGSFSERVGRTGATLALRLIPFASGTELLIARGWQVRGDRLRVVFERDSLVSVAKSLRLATGEYIDDSLTDRVLLRTREPRQEPLPR